jgi:predicted ABC-type ATPase
MSNITLYTTDENCTNGIREASFQEVLDAARIALAKRVRRGTGFTSPRVTADYLRVRLSALDHETERIRSWKAQRYSVEIAYLRLASPQLALSRVASRVKQGGHNVPRPDVLRRYKRGWNNFLEVYKALADHWTLYDNSEASPKWLERGP